MGKVTQMYKDRYLHIGFRRVSLALQSCTANVLPDLEGGLFEKIVCLYVCKWPAGPKVKVQKNVCH